MHAGASCAQHVQRDEQQHNASRKLESGHGDAEEFEDPFAGHGKNNEYSGHDAASQPRHANAGFRCIRWSHGEERGNGRQRINNYEERTGGEKDVFGQCHVGALDSCIVACVTWLHRCMVTSSNRAGRKYGIRHAVDDFFVSGTNGGEDSA